MASGFDAPLVALAALALPPSENIEVFRAFRMQRAAITVATLHSHATPVPDTCGRRADGDAFFQPFETKSFRTCRTGRTAFLLYYIKGVELREGANGVERGQKAAEIAPCHCYAIARN